MGFFGGATGGVDLGENNTASNQGVGGVGLFITKDGVDLQFRNINAVSSKISVTLDGANNEVDLDVVEANLDHGNISGLGDDDHTQYHTDIRGDIRYYTKTLLDGGQLDNSYFQESEFLNSSAGVADAGKPIILNASGLVADNMISFPPETDPFALKKDGSTVMSGSFDVDGNKIISTAAFSLESNSNSNQILLNTDGTVDIDGTAIGGPTSLPAATTIVGNISPALTGTNLTAVGSNAGSLVTSGVFDTFIGAASGDAVTTGNSLTAVGVSALGANQTVSNFTAIGQGALQSVTGGAGTTVAIGRGAGRDILISSASVFIGDQAGSNTTSSTGVIYIGANAGDGTTNIDNIYIGRRAGSGTIGKNNIILAPNAAGSFPGNGPTSNSASNEFIVGAPGSPILNMYIGEGGASATPQNVSINATQANGTDIAAGNFTLAAGAGTGTGIGGHLIFQTAPAAGSTGSTVNALVTRLQLTDDAKIGLYGVAPVVQASKINDPSGGATIDSEARTVINAILDALEGLGVSASA